MVESSLDTMSEQVEMLLSIIEAYEQRWSLLCENESDEVRLAVKAATTRIHLPGTAGDLRSRITPVDDSFIHEALMIACGEHVKGCRCLLCNSNEEGEK